MKRATNVTRSKMNSAISADVRAVSAHAFRTGRAFAQSRDISAKEFDALLQIMVAQTAGEYLSLGELGNRIGVSAPSVTAIVDSLIDAGHIRRERDPVDGRRALLLFSNARQSAGRAFCEGLTKQVGRALEDFSDEEIATSAAVMEAVVGAMIAYRESLS